MFSILLAAFLSIVSPAPELVVDTAVDVINQGSVMKDYSDFYTVDEVEGSASTPLDVSGNDIIAVAPLEEKLDAVLYALGNSVDAYQISEYYREYFKGVLQNMPQTEYLAYAQRVYNGGTQYITHYYLMYDLQIENGSVVDGSYPCIDVYNYNNVYYVEEITKSFDGYPTGGYASFAPYAALIDRSFDFNTLYIGLICVAVFFILGRKTIFS